MKWCQHCGQRMQVIQPGEKCDMCGWVRPLSRSAYRRSEKSLAREIERRERAHRAAVRADYRRQRREQEAQTRRPAVTVPPQPDDDAF